MQSQFPISRAFHRYAGTVIFFTILLIWWGAATTTKEAGMVFADWPLSLGSVNPPGWLKHMAPFLEHTHRLLATLVGVLVLAMFSWAYCAGSVTKKGKRIVELILLVVVLAVVFSVFIRAGGEKVSAAKKMSGIWAGVALGLIPIGWLVISWWKRGWTTLQKLSAVALLMVTTQAILGGLRVTEINNAFATVHGCFAQAFFCLLVLIFLRSGKHWASSGYFSSAVKDRTFQLGAGVVLCLLIFWQLLLGASMRHFHRSGLADTDLLKTQGQWIPDLGEPIIAVMFLHKLSAFLIFLFVIGLAIFLFNRRHPVQSRNHILLIAGLLVAQLALGLSVIATGKNFWITNFHVLNGLAILALAFVYAVRCLRLQKT